MKLKVSVEPIQRVGLEELWNSVSEMAFSGIPTLSLHHRDIAQYATNLIVCYSEGDIIKDVNWLTSSGLALTNLAAVALISTYCSTEQFAPLGGPTHIPCDPMTPVTQ